MRSCPKCEYRYGPWVAVCPDCDVPLEEEEPRDDDRVELVPLYSGSTIMCDLLTEALKATGIASIYRGQEPLLGIMGELARPPFGRLLISDRDLRQRRDELADALATVGEVLPEDAA